MLWSVNVAQLFHHTMEVKTNYEYINSLHQNDNSFSVCQIIEPNLECLLVDVRLVGQTTKQASVQGF